MEQTKNNWIIKESVAVNIKDGTDQEIRDQLIELLANNPHLLNKDVVRNDVIKREQIHSPRIKDTIVVPHATTTGVDSFCASMCIVDHKKLYVLVVWDAATPRNIKYMAAIMELLLDPKVQSKLCASQDNDELFEHIKETIHKYKI